MRTVARGIRRLLLLSGLLAAIPGLACAQTRITLGFTAANDALPAFVAKDHGFFEALGLAVDLQLVPNGSQIPAALLAGSLQIGTPTASIFLQAAENGLDLVVVAAASVFRRDNQLVSLLARPDGTVKESKDLVGARVAVPGLNGIMHIMLQKWLTLKGVDPRRVTYIESPLAQMGDMLRGRQVDAVVALEPFLSRIVESGSGAKVAPYFYEVSDEGLFGMYAATRRWAVDHPQAVKAFRAAIEKGIEFIRDQPDVAKQSLVRHLKLPADVVARQPLASYASEVRPEQLAFWQNLALEQG